MAYTLPKQTHAVALMVMIATVFITTVQVATQRILMSYYLPGPPQLLENHRRTDMQSDLIAIATGANFELIDPMQNRRGMDFHLGFESDVIASRGATFEVTGPYDDEIDIGVLSTRDPSFFRALETEIDEVDHTTRCARYRATYNTTHPSSRRIFYGSLVADEPWELLEIVAAESYGIYQGMVFVEGNRTQNFTPRPFRRLHHGPTLAKLFGVSESQVQVRAFVDEDPKLIWLARENAQRAGIIKGWKDLGMQPEDVGLLADADETFTRDFLRAVQVCDGIDMLEYERHHCMHKKVKLMAVSRVFESSPECVTDKRTWYHPDMIIGNCIDGISNSAKHAPAPRAEGSYLRAPGFGKGCNDWVGEENITDSRYPLWNAADFRMTCGGAYCPLVNQGIQTKQRLDYYTGFHFHNFFAQFNSTRFKYLTYGHADTQAGEKPIENLSNDLKLMFRCVKNLPDAPEQTYKRVQGGFNGINPFSPIYFQDEDYRRRRHAHVREMVEADERFMEARQRGREKYREAVRSTPLNRTNTGIDVSDPELYKASEDLSGDSSSATIIALATNYDLTTYKRFVGSLRLSGYKGHIILGLGPNPTTGVLDYLHSRNVTTKLLTWVNCTYTMDASADKDIFQRTTCASPYPDIKIRWSRYPLARDWLQECEACTGPVLFTDARDVIFQRDPFGLGSLPVVGLQVFQEHVNMTTENWLTEWPIRECKGVRYNEPMLCSGTTVGTRTAMLKYLEIMYEEMKVWIEDPKCRFNIDGDDQSIHDYLFYSGQLPFATSVVNRAGGIVNTVGYQAAQIAKAHFKRLEAEQDLDYNNARNVPFPGANETTWIGAEFGLTNNDGLFTEFDGSVSRVVHQWDRFDLPYWKWLHKQPWAFTI